MTDRDGDPGGVDEPPDENPDGRVGGTDSVGGDPDDSEGVAGATEVDSETPEEDPDLHDDDPDPHQADPDLPDVDPAPTGVERRLDPRVRLLWVGGALVGALVLGGIAGVAGFVLRGWLWPGPAVVLVVFALGAGHALLRYRRWCYEVRDDALYLERGVLTEVRTVVPYVRLQHVDVSRGPVERALGLATVVVYTAGSRGADVTVPGLTPGDADALQARLKRLAIAAEGDDAV